MSYLYDFPHTRKYDDDLGFLIEYYKEVKEAYDGTWARINELADYLETHLPELAIEYIDSAINEGRIFMKLKYQEVTINDVVHGALSFSLNQNSKG